MIIKEQTKNQCLNRIAALDALEEENRNTGKTKTRHFPRSIQKVYLQKRTDIKQTSKDFQRS